MRLFIPAVCCAALSACVPYPVYKQLQPQTRVHVVAEDGAALAGARVVLLASAHPYGREHHREVVTTDATGVATFPERREWRTETTTIHGWQEFFWNVCVSMPGRATYLTTHRSADGFEADATVVLLSGVSTPCPEPKEGAQALPL